MPYRIERSPRFLADVEKFGDYCKAHTSEYADRQFERLDYAIPVLIGESPSRWSPFVHTGHPYHAYLMRVDDRTQFWIVYTFDETSHTIRLLRLWGASRQETTFSTE